MKGVYYLATLWLVAAVLALPARSEEEATPPSNLNTLIAKAELSPQPVKPYRTFIQVKHYYVENTGDPRNPIANIRIEVTFPNGEKVNLPEGNQYWPIGNGQVQEINRVFEIPFAYVQNDGFQFKIQMVRKGSPMLPCEFNVTQLSDHNRSYVCRVDLNWQASQNIPEDQMDKEGVQVRVFTDRNTPAKEIPNNAIALR